jgi:hypothetical protein
VLFKVYVPVYQRFAKRFGVLEALKLANSAGSPSF